MVALNKYQRLEASGLWRETTEAQRREVIVAVGDATLVVTDMQERPLAHWSLPAVHRANPGVTPALYHPVGSPEETLEIAGDETEMIAAIEKLQKAIHKTTPRPGRLRGVALTGSIAAVVALGIFWLPGALRSHVTKVVPQINRVVIGQDIVAHLQSVTGLPCHEPAADAALKTLAKRVNVREIIVVPDGIRHTAALPGGAIVMSRTILEDHEDPAVAAGYLAAETVRAAALDPLEKLLSSGGIAASFRLLTTGQLTDKTLRGYAEALVSESPAAVELDQMLRHFSDLQLVAAPYGYAQDVSGETTLDLIEADAVLGQVAPVLGDGDWVALQEICTN
ncbi:hypothetical protein NBRC116601_02380 [Cognatishimia sp. WU-CL00825]|uniref:hypothetical protein n=1 Tax=Cognatishimia sp. WU-CL00825 TaxID=3127658 RepID=UPI00310977C5